MERNRETVAPRDTVITPAATAAGAGNSTSSTAAMSLTSRQSILQQLMASELEAGRNPYSSARLRQAAQNALSLGARSGVSSSTGRNTTRIVSQQLSQLQATSSSSSASSSGRNNNASNGTGGRATSSSSSSANPITSVTTNATASRSSTNNNSSSNATSGTVNPSIHPQFRSKAVCSLFCSHCSAGLCQRGMRAILLGNTSVELFSTDKTPYGVALVDKDYFTKNCSCRIRDAACLGCGNVVGYNVTQPCDRCLEACNNGHFWMFLSEAVSPVDRLEKSGAGSKILRWSSISDQAVEEVQCYAHPDIGGVSR